MAWRVVVVDDDGRFRALACQALVADGIDVVADVEDGVAAVEAVATWRPDLVLLDIGLPGIDGLEVARQLGRKGGGPVVILMSTRDKLHGQRMAAGLAAGYLPKDELSLAAIVEVVGPAP